MANKSMEKLLSMFDAAVMQRQQLLTAAKLGLEHLKQQIEDCGPCDHPVNICVCGLKADADSIAEAIEHAESDKVLG